VAWAVGFRVDGAVPGLLEHRGSRVDGWIAALRRGDRLQAVHPWFDPVPILGGVVNLRAHQERDVARMVEAIRDVETKRWLSVAGALGEVPDEYGEQHAHDHLSWVRGVQAAGKAVHWAMADPDADRLLGEVAIFIRDQNQGEIGYWTHPDARGKGATTEAVRLAVRHALLPVADWG
jgi:RimJ/RimL family protein N-acetyltransferase